MSVLRCVTGQAAGQSTTLRHQPTSPREIERYRTRDRDSIIETQVAKQEGVNDYIRRCDSIWKDAVLPQIRSLTAAVWV